MLDFYAFIDACREDGLTGEEALDEVNETAYRLAGHTPFYSIESVSMKGEQ